MSIELDTDMGTIEVHPNGGAETAIISQDAILYARVVLNGSLGKWGVYAYLPAAMTVEVGLFATREEAETAARSLFVVV